MYTYEMTAEDIEKQDHYLAIIPVGSLEQHGPHLPIMTDWVIADAIGKGVAKKTGGFLIPTLPISTCREHMGKKGSVWMEPPTFYQMMTDIILSLKTQGFNKICIIQGHGGIFIMTPLVRDLNAKYNPGLMVANIDTMSFSQKLYEEGLIETNTELHAGELETSKMLALASESVHMDRAVDFVPNLNRSYLNYGSIFRATPFGVWGEPSRATKEKGQKLLKRSIELAVEEMNKIFTYMEKKDKFGYSDF